MEQILANEEEHAEDMKTLLENVGKEEQQVKVSSAKKEG